MKIRRCEDVKMIRREDVKIRRCEDEKMRRCEDEDVKMRRCDARPPLLEELFAQTLSGKNL